MFGLRGLFGGQPQVTDPYPANKEVADLEDATRATGSVMDDDIETAEKELSKYDSAYHSLGLGTMAFMRAALGAESEEMKQAFQRLTEAETVAMEAHRRVQDDKDAFRSEIYAPGAEFSLAQAETQMMTALVAILTESLTESIKGFYKVRRAYNTFSSIHNAERTFLRSKEPVSENGIQSSKAIGWMRSASFSSAARPGSARKGSIASSAHEREDPLTAVKEELGEEDLRPKDTSENMNGDVHLERSKDLSRSETRTSTVSRNNARPQLSHRIPSSSSRLSHRVSNASRGDDLSMTAHDDEFIKSIFSHPIDAFIHSGVNFQYGMLQLILSLVPPTFSRLLSIVGFQGNRKQGLAMLWQASRFEDVHGAVAGLVISAYYTTMISLNDIYLFDNQDMYPIERIKALLTEMRTRYPLSSLWKIEECRIHASERQLEKAVEIFDEIPSTPFKQIDAICAFEKGLDVLALHRYADVAESFLKCLKFNDWSKGLYYYIIGSAHVELYRNYKYGMNPDTAKAAHHAKEAEAMLQKVLRKVGKKRFVGRQLPFDTLVARKINKWTLKAKTWDIPLIDAIGVSPTEEVAFFMGMHSRMRTPHLEESLQRLAWSDGQFPETDREPLFKTSNPHWINESLDEKAVLALLRAHVYRRLGKIKESEALIQDAIMVHKPADFKGGYKDAWVAPVARYELATLCWQESGMAVDRVSGLPTLDTSLHMAEANEEATNGDARKAIDKAKLRECRAYLEKVANWERFDLHARFGLLVATARETMKSLGY